jgi:GcrA cell cycle regulator
MRMTALVIDPRMSAVADRPIEDSELGSARVPEPAQACPICAGEGFLDDVFDSPCPCHGTASPQSAAAAEISPDPPIATEPEPEPVVETAAPPIVSEPPARPDRLDLGTSTEGWSERRVAALKAMHGRGDTYSRIGAALRVTRSAISGMVSRLGLDRPGRAPRSSKKPAARRAAVRDRPVPVEPARPAPLVVARPPANLLRPAPVAPAPRLRPEPAECRRITLMELRETTCRWPLGDPRSAEFRYCGARSVPAAPYCPHHSALAYELRRRSA